MQNQILGMKRRQIRIRKKYFNTWISPDLEAYRALTGMFAAAIMTLNGRDSIVTEYNFR